MFCNFANVNFAFFEFETHPSECFYSILFCVNLNSSGFQLSLDNLSASYRLLSYISSYQIVNSVCWSHALGNDPTSKRPASDGGLCIGALYQ